MESLEQRIAKEVREINRELDALGEKRRAEIAAVEKRFEKEEQWLVDRRNAALKYSSGEGGSSPIASGKAFGSLTRNFLEVLGDETLSARDIIEVAVGAKYSRSEFNSYQSVAYRLVKEGRIEATGDGRYRKVTT